MDEPRTVLFVPSNLKQKKFIESPADEILYSGAVGAGKSRGGCEKGYLLNLMYPGNVGVILRKELKALRATTLVTLLKEVIPPEHVVAHLKNEQRIIHRTGWYWDGKTRSQEPSHGEEIFSEIWYFGLDQSAESEYPTKILSTQFGWGFMDETTEFKEKDWEVIVTRLRYNVPYFTREENDHMVRQMFGATNPDGPKHWLAKKFFSQGNVVNDKGKVVLTRDVFLATPYDNPHLAPSYIRKLEAGLSGLTRDRLLLGLWRQAEGIIYRNFNPSTMVIDEEVSVEDGGFLPLHQYEEFIIGADSNYPKPRAAVFIGLFKRDGKQGFHVLDEHYIEEAPVESVLNWALAWKDKVRRSIRLYHDPSDPEAIKKLSVSGLLAQKAANAVNPGIADVAYLFDNDLIRIHKQCTGLISELQSYIWKKDVSGKEAREQEPDKSYADHAVDALRYSVHSFKTMRTSRYAVA